MLSRCRRYASRFAFVVAVGGRGVTAGGSVDSCSLILSTSFSSSVRRSRWRRSKKKRCDEIRWDKELQLHRENEKYLPNRTDEQVHSAIVAHPCRRWVRRQPLLCPVPAQTARSDPASEGLADFSAPSTRQAVRIGWYAKVCDRNGYLAVLIVCSAPTVPDRGRRSVPTVSNSNNSCTTVRTPHDDPARIFVPFLRCTCALRGWSADINTLCGWAVWRSARCEACAGWTITVKATFRHRRKNRL